MFSNSLAPVLSAYKASIRQNSAVGAVSLPKSWSEANQTMIAVPFAITPHAVRLI